MADISTNISCSISFTDEEMEILQKASEIFKRIGHEIWLTGHDTDEEDEIQLDALDLNKELSFNGAGRMERKVFYALIHKKGSTGIEQKEGYEFEINNNKFYGYINNESCKVYIIDPETGRSIYNYPIDDKYQEINVMKYTIDRLTEDEYVLAAFESKKNSPKYELMKKIFKFFFAGAELEEKLKTK